MAGLACVVVVAGVAGVLLAVDVWAGESRTSATSTVSTASVGNATVGTPPAVVLFVDGEDRLAAAAATRAADRLRARGVAATRAETLKADYDRPVLVATVVAETAYDPVTPTATVRVRTLYSASGTLTQFGVDDGAFSGDRLVARLRADELGSVESGDEYPLVRVGTVTVEDRTRGVVSRPAYRRHVADLAGDAIAATLDATPA